MNSANTTPFGLVQADNQDALKYIKVGTNDLLVIYDGVGVLPRGTLAI